jgi:gamma-glutamyltranspeptidase/glutathione hydrolase
MAATFKQPVHASQAVVSANHPVASAAGLSILARGGNVVDAAIAAVATTCVVLPQMVSPLGGGYILYRDSAGATSVIDNRTEGPLRATDKMFAFDARGRVVEDANATGHLAAGTPGSIKGWWAFHEAHGHLPMEEVLDPAITAAERGFVVTPYLHAAFTETAPMLARFAETARVYLPGGKTPVVGEVLKNPDLGASYRALASEGPDLLYHGALGDALVEEMARGGGLITKEDLAGYALRHPDPIRGTYRDNVVIGTPLSSSGGILNQFGFNVLENFDLAATGFGTSASFHLVIETLKLMFAERERHFGDPAFVDVPVERLLDKGYATARAQLIDTRRAASFVAGEALIPEDRGHTTHVTVMDASGATVSMTQTINLAFGSRVVVPGTGMLLNDNMASFDPRPHRPNSPGPRKRMLSAMAPTIVEQPDGRVFALGTPGGNQIFPSIFQSILNVIDHKMTLQEAIEAPRVFADGRSSLIERLAGEHVRGELEGLGHELKAVHAIAGNTNGAVFDRAIRLLSGAACWRGDGAPAGLSGGLAAPE